MTQKSFRLCALYLFTFIVLDNKMEIKNIFISLF